ncbi:MAG: hypothetical protein M0P57_10325 [Syntrophales bacterium]|nr:hypothetical protein [Syntrophales bacterium]MDY0044550.1 hypothetical protein [Syntrophales bacterium]
MNKNSVIDAVLFDFGGVIAEEGFMKGLRAMAQKSKYTSDEFVRLGNEIIHSCGYVAGMTTEDLYWDLIREETGIRGSNEELRNEILSRFILRPWVIGIVDELRSREIVTGILSDQTNWLDELEERHHFFSHFHFIFNSYYLGISKRERKIFKKVADSIGTALNRIIFIDDQEENCRRAGLEGIHTLLYVSKEKLIKDLKEYFPELCGNRSLLRDEEN